jgi:hypothetical protein
MIQYLSLVIPGEKLAGCVVLADELALVNGCSIESGPLHIEGILEHTTYI